MERTKKSLEDPTTSKIDNYMWTKKDMESHNREEPLLLMGPWLRTGEHTFIYGSYGIGKSLLALSVAYLLGLKNPVGKRKEIGPWKVKNTTGCFYIDGEMGMEECLKRLQTFHWLGEQAEDKKTTFFNVPDYQLDTGDNFSLSERKNQLKIIDWLKRHPTYKLLVLDSVDSLFQFEKDNNNSEWNKTVNPFLSELRVMGVACILICHVAKGIKQYEPTAMGIMAQYIFRLTNHPCKAPDEGEAWFTILKDMQRAGGFSFRTFSLHYYQIADGTQTEWCPTENN